MTRYESDSVAGPPERSSERGEIPTVRRFSTNPMIAPTGEPGTLNINGPSLIRAPSWLRRPLGRYYLYFASHVGTHIRLACADQLEGPWRVHAQGTLQLSQTICRTHIASPDVHVSHETGEILMYFHGDLPEARLPSDDAYRQSFPILGNQRTLLARSKDGVHFRAEERALGPSYMRVFRWKGSVHAIGMPGVVLRSDDGVSAFTRGPALFSERMRHSALRIDGETLEVYYSNAGDAPESILRACIGLGDDWRAWTSGQPVTILRPETAYEGGDLPIRPSRRGMAHGRVRELRDPAIYEEDGRTFLLYAVAGESGLAMAEVL
jgi:hypothetical protein